MTTAAAPQSAARQPVFFISHGGGPWPWMAERTAMYARLKASLEALAPGLPARPRAILMVTGHWEEPVVAISAQARPGMLYDYYGFPPHTYQIDYPAPGSPALALQVQQLLNAGGVPARPEGARGYDHGTFVVAAVAFPDADLPVVQMSLQEKFDPAQHLHIGRLLAPLRDEGVLIIGSGASHHNRHGSGPLSRLFDAWLQDTLVHSAPAARAERLMHWEDAPGARDAHAREEHLLPLMVAAGAAGTDAGACVYHDETLRGDLTSSGFRFG